MSNKQVYRQCKMERPVEGSESSAVHQHVAWIPAVFAKVGKKVSFKDVESEEWKHGWVVVEVWGSMDVDDIELQRKAQKRWEHVLDHGVRD